MENLQSLIKDLRGILQEALESVQTQKMKTSFQSQVRMKVKEQMSRKDLRIPVELSLAEILHEFEGFDSAPQESKTMVLEDTEKILNRIESLLETDAALNLDRIDLPPPPSIVAEVIAEELKAFQIEEEPNFADEHGDRHLSQDPSRRQGPRNAPPQDSRQGRRRGRNRRPDHRPQGGQSPAPSPINPPAPNQPADRGVRSDLKFNQPAPPNQPPRHDGGSHRRRRPPRHGK